MHEGPGILAVLLYIHNARAFVFNIVRFFEEKNFTDFVSNTLFKLESDYYQTHYPDEKVEKNTPS